MSKSIDEALKQYASASGTTYSGGGSANNSGSSKNSTSKKSNPFKNTGTFNTGNKDVDAALERYMNAAPEPGGDSYQQHYDNITALNKQRAESYVARLMGTQATNYGAGIYDAGDYSPSQYQSRIDLLTAEKNDFSNNWAGTKNPNKDRTYADKINEYDKLIEDARAAKWAAEGDEKYSNLSRNSDYGTLSKKIDESLGKTLGITLGDKYYGAGDDVYAYINNVGGRRDRAKEGHNQGTAGLDKYDYMTEEQIANYNYLYQKEGKKSANDYLDYISYELNNKRASEFEKNTQDWINEDTGSRARNIGRSALASAISVPENLMSGAGLADIAIQNISRNISGEYRPIDYNTLAMQGTLASSTIRGTIAQNIADKTGRINLSEEEHPVLSKILNGKSLGDVYQLGMSMADSRALGLAVGPGASHLLGGAAGSQGILDALEKGADDRQALSMGVLNGLFEDMFEYISLDKLLNGNTGKFWSDLLANTFVEGSEELSTSLFNTLADISVMAEKSDWQRSVQEYINAGLSEKEAYKATLRDTAISMGWDFVGGAIMGGLSSAGVSALNSSSYGAENTADLMSEVKARQEAGFTVEGADSYADALAKRQEKYDAQGKGKQASLTRGEATRLGNALLNSYGGREEYIKAITQEAEAAEAEIKAEAEKTVARRSAGLREGSSYSINKGDATISVLNSDEAGNDIDGETTDFRITGMARENGRNVVRFVNENGETESVAVEDAGEAIGGDAGRFIRRLNAELGEYAPGAYELYEDGQDVDDYITLMDRAINLYAKNGADVRNITQGVMAETLTPSQLLFAQSAGNRLNTAERAEANRTAAELKQAVASAREASDVVALSRTRRQIEGYIKSLKQTRQQLAAALAGLETGTDEYNSISARIRALDAKIASNESLLEGVKEDIADAQKREHKGKKGSVSLNGGIVGTSQLAPVKSELNNKQKAAVEMAEALADVLPIRFTFFEGDAKDTQGLFIETGEIFVNINSGMAINKVLAASTISHELTHFIRQNSPADYIELRDYLVGKFVEQNGQEKFDGLISGRVREVMSEGVNADEAYDRAVEEFVCNACEDMLMDSKAVQRLAYENMSLFEKVKKWVEQTIAKIKAAYEDLDTFRAEAVFGRTLDGLQEIWDNALVNATRNFNATTGRTRAQVNENAAPESDVKFQVWDDKNGIEGFSDKAREAIELRGNAIAEDETELAYHVSRALTTKEQQTVYIGGIKDSVIGKIEGEIGRSIRKKPGQYVYGITYDSIRHLREHFDSNDKIREAINRLASMLTDHDTIESLRRGDKLIINLEKAISGRNYLSVNIAATNKRALDIHTVYITGSEKNRSLSAGDTSTSAKVGASASANNIAQRGEQSKAKYQAWDSTGNELTEGQQEYFRNSVVRDGEDRLLRVYHGTPSRGFNYFSYSKAGTVGGKQAGYGFYFSGSRKEAELYAQGKGHVKEGYLNITNPIIGQNSDLNATEILEALPYSTKQDIISKFGTLEAAAEGIERYNNATMLAILPGHIDAFPEVVNATLMKLGYDGVVNEEEGYEAEYVAFRSDQFKNVDNKNPTASEDFRYQEWNEGEYAPAFYSQMAKTIDGIKQNKLGASSVVSYLRGRGVKAEEIKWSGIEEFLKGKKSVTKEELQAFAAASRLEIEEEILTNTKQERFDTFIESARKYYDFTPREIGEFFSDEMGFNEDEFNDVVNSLYNYGFISLDDQAELAKLGYDYMNSETDDGARWASYRLDGGSNYREILFKMPGSSYSNNAMRVHWGKGGVLAHARLQDVTTSDRQHMLFIEEIQSDWHNAGHKEGYRDEAKLKRYERATELSTKRERAAKEHIREMFGQTGEKFIRNELSPPGDKEAVEQMRAEWRSFVQKYNEENPEDAAYIRENLANYAEEHKIPNAPFKDSYTDFAIKRILRMAAEEGYDSIGWTTAEQQTDRWTDAFEEGYRIEYDQDIPKFLNKYGKQWGGKVDTAHIYAGWDYAGNGADVWRFTIPETMKQSVLQEGQPLYQKWTDYSAMTIDELEDEIQNVNEQLAGDIDGTESRRLNNLLTQLNYLHDRRNEELSARAVRTSLNDILNNLDNYTNRDLVTIGNELTSSAWDGLEELSDDEIREGIREIIEERAQEMAPEDMNDPRYGAYVIPPSRGNIVSLRSRRQVWDGELTYDSLRDMQTELNSTVDSISKIEKSGEYNRLIKAALNDTDGEALQAFLDYSESSGLNRLTERRKELEEGISSGTTQLNSQQDEKTLADYSRAVEASGLSEEDYRRKEAHDEFGYTTNFKEAGYMLPDGKLLDFSGKREGGPRGYRSMDHRSISRIYPSLNSDDGMGTDKLIRFVSEGNIRLMPELPGIEISAEKPLTNEQYSGIRRMIQTLADDYMSVDIMAEKGNIAGHLEYEGTVRPDRVINDLKHYYETGEVREQGLSAYYQKWSEDQFSLFDEETGRLHPELQRRIDEAEKLKEDLKRFFSGGDYSEYGITDEMIEDSLDINLYAAAGESDADVDDVFMALNEISKDIGRDEREKVYELMRGLTRHMKASQAARWQGYGNRNGKAPNEGFADWNRAKDGFVNFGRTRAVSSSMLSDEERAYMEREFNAILNDESASAELKEDARRNLKRLNNRNAVWYQKWEDGQELFDMVDELADVKSAEYQKWSEDTGDTAKEAANRDRAFATMKAENESLRDIVNSLRAELKESTKQQNRAEAKLERAERQTRRTEMPEVRLDDAKKIARSLIKRFESGTDANDIAARIKELGDYIVSVTGETVDYDTVKSMARDIAYEVLSDVNVPLEEGNEDLDSRQAIASAIKGRRFTVMQQDKGELDVEGGYNDFRKKNFGKFTLVNEGGESIDSAYTELQNTYGTVYFPEVNSPGEMIMIMADLVDNAEPVMGNPYEDYMAEATEQAANDIIYDAIGETLRQMPETLADKLAKAKAVSRAELRAARNAAKEDRSAAVAKERAAARARYEALQERSAKRIAEIKAEGKARVQEVRAHEKAEKWKKVKSIHDYYLEKEERAREARNEAASVTQYKERIIRKATNLMDRVTANTGKKHVPEALRAPLAEFLSTIRFDSKRSLAGGPETQNDLAMAERMSDLADVLAQQKNYQDGAQDAADIMGAYLDLPDGIIEQMRDIARNARDYIRRAGGDYTINTMNSLELRALDQTLDVITAAVNGLNRFHENNVYNHVDEAGASTIRELGELPEISARLRAEAKRRGLSEKDISDFLSWDNTVPIYAFKRFGEAGSSMFDELYRGWSKMAVNAEKVIEFAVSAYSGEEANAWNNEKKALTYIDAAGEPVSVEMSVSELMTLYELLKRNQARQHIFGGGIQVPGTSSNLYAVDGRIIAELEQVLTQRQKDVADTLQRYMQDEGGRLGNEVTQARWGISSFGEEHYFPIETVSSDRNADGQEVAPMRSQDLYRLMNMGFTKSLNKYANNAVVIRPIFAVFSNHMMDMVKYNALTMPMLDAMKWYNYRERTDVEGSGTAFLTDSVQRSIERAYGKGANGYFINFMKDMNGVNEGGRGEGRLKGLISNYKVAQIGFNLRVVMQQPTSIARAALNINPKYLIKGAVTKGDREEMLKHSGIAVWKIALGFYDVNINSSARQQIEHTDSLKDKVQNASTWAAGKADEITWAAMWRACKAEQRDLGYTGEELIARTVDRFDHLMLSTQVMDSTISRSQNMRSTTIAMSEYTGFMSEPTMSYNTLLDAYMDFRGEMRKKGFDAAMKSRGGRMIKAVLVWQISEALVSAVAAIADAARDDDEYETFLQKWLEHWAENYADSANPLSLVPIVSDAYELIRYSLTQKGYSNEDSMATAGLKKFLTFLKDAAKMITGEGTGKKTPWGVIYEGLQAGGMLSGIPAAPVAREVTALHNGFVTIYNDTLGIEYDDRLDYWKTYDEGEKAAIKSAVENGYLDDEAAANALVEADAYDSTEKASQAVYEWSVKAEGYDSKYGKLYEAVMAGDDSTVGSVKSELQSHGYTDEQINGTIKQNIEEWYTDPATQFDRQQALNALTRYAGMEYADADSKLSYWFYKSETPNCGNTQKTLGPALRASESRGIITRAEARKIWQGCNLGWVKSYDEWLSEN